MDFNSSDSYFDNIDRIASATYVPIDQDLLRLRSRSTGIISKEFFVNDITYNIYDVSGPEWEFRRMQPCYENTDVVIFVADISAYHRCSHEYHMHNTMHESLRLFDTICSLQCFKNTSIILCFTKVDLLQRKLAVSPFRDHFPDFNGDALSFEAVKAYIVTRFLSASQGVKEDIQVCFTDMADDTCLGKSAFAALEMCIKIKEGWI